MTVDFKVGDCGVRLKEIPDNSIDCMVTDPPYGYSFMGKDWDKVVIGPEIWKECLRVLKPGAFAFVMSAPRQDVLSRMMINLENSGFETGFTSIYWTYATGFPKGMNMSKAIDKRKGVEPTKVKKKDYTGPEFADKQFKEQGSMMQTHETAPRIEQWETKPTTEKAKEMEGSYAGFQPKPAVEVIIVCMKPLSEKNYVDQAMKNGKGVTWLNDCRIPYKSENDLDGATFGNNSGLIKKDKNDYGDFSNFEYKEKIKADPEGRYPANLLSSDNVLDIGKETKSPSGTVNRKKREGNVFTGSSCGFDSENQHESGYGDKGDFSRYFDLDKWEPEGRYPSNLLSSDNVLDVGKKTKSQKTKTVGGFGTAKNTYEGRNDDSSLVDYERGYDDEGDYSRYFDVDRWWANFIVTPKASKSEKNKGLDNFEAKPMGLDAKNRVYTDKCATCKLKFMGGEPRCHCPPELKITDKLNGYQYKNTHPTVKPLKLMSYLITLGSRPNDTILDPFSGSGTTCLAANILGRNAIGIELNPEYAKIAKARLEGWN